MKPHDPLASLPCPVSGQQTSSLHADRIRRKLFYSQLAGRLGPPDVDACVDFIGRTYGLDRKDRR